MKTLKEEIEKTLPKQPNYVKERVFNLISKERDKGYQEGAKNQALLDADLISKEREKVLDEALKAVNTPITDREGLAYGDSNDQLRLREVIRWEIKKLRDKK